MLTLLSGKSSSLQRVIKNKFHKQERLCSKKRIDILFAKGQVINRYPVKLLYLATDVSLPFPAQALFVVPKRNFKHANDRNLLKRRMREVYRLHKNELYLRLGENKRLLAFVYFSKKSEDYAIIEKSMLTQLQTLGKENKP